MYSQGKRRREKNLKLMMVLILYSVAARMPLLIYYPTLYPAFSFSTRSSSASFIYRYHVSHISHARSCSPVSHTTQPNTNTNSHQYSSFL